MLRYLLPLLWVAVLSCGADEVLEPGSEATGDPAITQLTELIAAQPTNAELYAQRATVYYERENLPDAIADLRRATELDSLTPDYAYGLAEVYLDSGEGEQAIAVLERTARTAPGQLETQLRLGEAQLIEQQYAAATTTLNAAITLDASNPEAYYLLSQVQAEAGDTTRAIRAAEEATRLDPDMTDAFLLLGDLAAGQQDPRAQVYYDAAVKIDSNDVIAIHARANYLYQRGEVLRALAEYRHVSTIDRQYVEGNFNAGLILLELDSLRQAYTEFNIAASNDPGNLEAYLYRGYASEQLGDVAGARRDFETVLRMDPDFIPAQEALARLNG